MKKHIFGATIAFLNNGNFAAKQASGICNRMSAAEINDEAENLSNHDGGQGGGYYVGYGDDFLDFIGDQSSFADAIDNSKVFTLILANSAGATRTALLCPGLDPNTVGTINDGAFNDASNAAGLTAASNSTGTVNQFKWFMQKFPSYIYGMVLKSNSITQMGQAFTIQQESPFKIHSTKVINSGSFQSPKDFNTQILPVNEPYFMDSQTRMSYPVLAGAQVSIDFYVGVSLNTAKALRSKTGQAKKNIQLAGGAQVVQGALMAGK